MGTRGTWTACAALVVLLLAAPALAQTKSNAPAQSQKSAIAPATAPATAPEPPKPSTDAPSPAKLILAPPPDLPPQTAPPASGALPSVLSPPPERLEFHAGTAAEIVRAMLALVIVFGLAYAAGQPRVREWERRLRISQVVTAGLPFVFFGVVARMQDVGILSPAILWEIRPLLALGLGWIGFTVGFRFDSTLVESLAPGAAAMSLLTALAPFASILGMCALLLVFIEHSPATAVFLRDALILATAGAMTAYSVPHLLAARGAAGGAVNRLTSIVRLEQLVGIMGLLVLAAYFRPGSASVAWQLPGTAWLFITLGMGTAMGGLVYGVMNRVHRGPEFTVVVLGSICFAAGMAGYLRLSPLAVCFIVGLMLANLPGGPKAQVRAALESMERPIYLLFLVVAGSLWDVMVWQGWVLMVLFVAARLVGKAVAAWLCRKRVPGGLTSDEERSLVFSPIGALSIAIMVSAEDLYFGPTISWMVTAVIGGAIVTEVIVQLAARGRQLDDPEMIGLA